MKLQYYYFHQPEKIAIISRHHHWFPREMTCVKRAQEFLTDDTSLRDLGSASDWSCCMENLLWPIRSTIQIWLVTHHQYGILVLVAQTSFHRETSCGVTKCWLFSQAILSAFENVSCNSVHFFLFFSICITNWCNPNCGVYWKN